MVRKKKFNFNNPKFIDLQNKILKFKDNVYSPKFEESKNKNIIKNNSCFNISIFDDKNNIKIPKITKNLNNKDDKILKITDKIYLKFNKKQKHVLKLWFETNDLMYNTTIKFIKDNFQNMKNEFNNSLEIYEFIEINNKKYKLNLLFENNKKIINNNKTTNDEKYNIIKKNIIIEIELFFINKIFEIKKIIVDNFLKEKPYSILFNKINLNWQNIRTSFLKNIRDSIIENCKSKIFKENVKIKAHILDATIKLACSNYQSAITNFENGNIKHFRIRYWKNKRSKRVIEIEPNYFSNGSLCPSITVFHNLKGFYKKGNKKIKFDFNTIKSTSKIHYNKKTKEYCLLLTKKIECKENKNIIKKNIIGIDLGLRMFATCLSDNQVIDICNTKNTKLKKLIDKRLKLKKILYIKNNKKNNKKLLKINKRIKGFVDELHWKTIKFLTDNYKNILIGDLSTKGIVCNNKSVLTKENKELAYAFSFYEFRQKLEYKCKAKKCNYTMVNEYCTSVTCSNCSKYNEFLGSSKEFNCNFCKSIFDRDVNGCRNIIIKCL